MDNIEQNVSPAILDLEKIERPVVGFSYDYRSGHCIPPHRHRKAQLIFASSGVMSVTTEVGTWVVPTHRAVWVPGRIQHKIRMSGEVHMRTLYLDQRAITDLPTECCVVTVSDLTKELILRVVSFKQPYPLGGREERMVTVLLDELATINATPLFLRMPQDSRLFSIVSALSDDPSNDRTLTQWSRDAGASQRTLSRLFLKETGMTFGRWRRQLRLLSALEKLAAGQSVTTVALSLGYDSPSAFIAMFRQHLEKTPAQYFNNEALNAVARREGPDTQEISTRRSRQKTV